MTREKAFEKYYLFYKWNNIYYKDANVLLTSIKHNRRNTEIPNGNIVLIAPTQNLDDNVCFLKSKHNIKHYFFF